MCSCKRKGLDLSPNELAEAACEIELDLCGEPIGKQDQYAASFGGTNIFEFSNEGVRRIPLKITQSHERFLADHMVLISTNTFRSASALLAEQSENMKKSEFHDKMSDIVALVSPAADAIVRGDLKTLGELVTENWEIKKLITSKTTNQLVDQIISDGLERGAYGAKLLGAGSGGFVLFICDLVTRRKLIEYFGSSNLLQVSVHRNGCEVLEF